MVSARQRRQHSAGWYELPLDHALADPVLHVGVLEEIDSVAASALLSWGTSGEGAQPRRSSLGAVGSRPTCQWIAGPQTRLVAPELQLNLRGLAAVGFNRREQ